jgi:hypothetical protein
VSERDGDADPTVDAALDATLDDSLVRKIAAAPSVALPDELAAPPLVAGGALGKYRLERPLGRGGMGEVWAAHDPDLDRRVAIKVLRPGWSGSEDAKPRLLREGRAMARLRHPNVVVVHEATSAGGRDLIVMEWVDGVNLGEWLRAARTPAEIADALLAAGRGLAAAHAAGMVHRDFKPANVLVGADGRIAVTDFGLARATSAPAAAAGSASASVSAPASAPDPRDLATPLTETGALLGTPPYMAPEQLDGLPADPRADQYAFCVTAWEAFAGERPFPGSTMEELVALASLPSRAPRHADRVPAHLRPLLERGLSLDPAARFPSMTALLSAFDRAWTAPRRRRRALAIGALAAAAAGAVVAAVVVARRRDAPAPAECTAPAADADTARALERVRTRSAAGERAAARVDRWRREWTSARTSACAAGAALAARPCVAALRGELADTVAVLDGLTPGEIASVEVALLIRDPLLCVRNPTAVTVVPPAPPVAATVRQVRTALVAANIRRRVTGKSDDVTFDRLLAEARATGYAPLVAEALVRKASSIELRDEPAAHAIYREAVDLAETVGDDGARLDALTGQLRTIGFERVRRDEAAVLVERMRSIVRRLDDPARTASFEASLVGYSGSLRDWDAAIAHALAARDAFAAIDAPASRAAAMRSAAVWLDVRGGPGDRERAEALLREALAGIAPDDLANLRVARGDLAHVLWRSGKLAEAGALYELIDGPPEVPAEGIEVLVRVTDGGVPATGVPVAASAQLSGDAVHLVRRDAVDDEVLGTTGADGSVRLVVPAAAVIAAGRLPDRVAGAVAPATSGETVALELGPAVEVSGRVTIPTAVASALPALSDHRRPMVIMSTKVQGEAWGWAAPVTGDGTWKLHVPPGTYDVSAHVHSALDDVQMATARLTVGTAPVELALAIAAPAPIEVVTRPAHEGVVVAAPGAHRVTTWAAALALLARPGQIATALAGEPELTTSTGHMIGDGVAWLGAPDAGTVTVCFLPDVVGLANEPIHLLEPGPDAPPPRCTTTTVAADRLTTVLLKD